MKNKVAGTHVPTAFQDAPSSIVTATAGSLPEQPHALARARAFAEPLIASEVMDTGENILAHADAVVAILKKIGGSEAMQAATYLVHSCQHLNKPQEVIAKAFGASYAALAVETTKLIYVQRQTRSADPKAQLHEDPAAQTENVRRMLLAFSRDLRVVMLRLLRACRPCAITRPAGRPRPGRWRMSRCMCLLRWPTDWGDGRSSGQWKTCPSVFWSPKPTSR